MLVLKHLVTARSDQLVTRGLAPQLLIDYPGEATVQTPVYPNFMVCRHYKEMWHLIAAYGAAGNPSLRVTGVFKLLQHCAAQNIPTKMPSEPAMDGRVSRRLRGGGVAPLDEWVIGIVF